MKVKVEVLYLDDTVDKLIYEKILNREQENTCQILDERFNFSKDNSVKVVLKYLDFEE